MKKFILLSLLCISYILPAQNYQNICSQGVTFYIDTASNLKGFRYDSLQVTVAHDSVFTAFPTILYNNVTGIADSVGGTILGRKIIRKHDGWFLFFNKNGDTIFLDTHAKLNYLWKFFTLPGNGYIGAKITSITSDTIMGVEDSVKVINLQAYDSQSNPVSHPFNGKFLKLSKHYGLSLVYNFWIFPELFSSYEICGKTHPGIGVRALRMIDVYDYDIGDEFHYHVIYQNLDYHGNHFDSKYMLKVVSKTMATDSSGVTYKYSICYSGSYSLFPTGGGSNSGSFDRTVTYDFKALEDKYYFDRLPDEFFCYRNGYANRFSSRLMSYNTLPRVQNRINEMVYARNSATGGQWTLLSTAYPGVYVDYWSTFATGLGLTHKYNHGMYGYISDSTLVYFKKADEISGNPVAKDCNALVGKPQDGSGNPVIEVRPNPVIAKAEIVLTGFDMNDDLYIILYDCSGREVYKTRMNSTSFIFDRYGFQSGLYFISVRDGNNVMKGKTKIVMQ